MMQVSEQAFNLVHSKLDNLTSYPVNTPFVIIDSTGLSSEFRESILKLGKKNNYNVEMVLFNYKKRSLFFQFDSNRVIEAHIKKLYKDVLPNLKAKLYKKVHKITDFMESISVDIQNLALYKECCSDKDISVIGDIHGCFDDFINLLEKMGLYDATQKTFLINPDDEQIVLLGDLIDKGPDSLKVINFVLNHKTYFRVVLGNHENFVYKFLRKEIKNKFEPEFLKENFQTIDEIPLDIISQLVDISIPFVKTDTEIVTHAPCKLKYLGKLDKKSLTKQRNIFLYFKEKDAKTPEEYIEFLEKELAFLKDGRRNYPQHFFGHIALNSVLKLKDSICLDTGCSYGNKLSGWRKRIFSVSSKKAYRTNNLVDIFTKKVDLSLVDEKDKARIEYSIRDRVNFVSGTISPANKTATELESVDEAFNYYRNNGVNKLIIQKKYMGSRGTVYLSEEGSYATSRNGFKIKIDMDNIYNSLLKRLRPYMKRNNVKMIIIDGELMPWAALGKNLIENEFRVVGACVQSELDILKESGFESVLDAAKNELQRSKFLDEHNKSKKELIAEYGEPEYNLFKYLKDYELIQLSEQENYINTYNNQVKIFGAITDTHYKPFAILKEIYLDDTEKNFISNEVSNEEMFKLISDDDYFVVDLSDDSMVTSAKEFIKNVNASNEEGVVLKPIQAYIPRVAPFMKVRNLNYLSIIYGYDFMNIKNYKKLIKKKSTSKKIKLSIKEYDLGRQLLNVPYKEITINNEKYKQILAELILEEKKERDLDPKL